MLIPPHPSNLPSSSSEPLPHATECRPFGAFLLLALLPPFAILACAPSFLSHFSVAKAPIVAFGLLLSLRFGLPSLRPASLLGGSWLAFLGFLALSLLWSDAPARGEIGLWPWLFAALWLDRLRSAFAGLSPQAVQTLWAIWLSASALAGGIGLFGSTASSTLGNPNRLAGLLLLALPAAAWLVFDPKRPSFRLLGVFCGCVCVAGLWATRCFSALLGAAVFFFLALLALVWRRRLRTILPEGGEKSIPPAPLPFPKEGGEKSIPPAPLPFPKEGGVGRTLGEDANVSDLPSFVKGGEGGGFLANVSLFPAVLLLLGVATGAWWLPASVWSSARKSLDGRIQISRVSREVWKTSPLFGVGLGGYPSKAAFAQGRLLTSTSKAASAQGRRSRTSLSWLPLMDAHSQIFDIAANLGLIGLLLFLAVAFLLLARLWKLRREPPAILAWLALLSLLPHAASETLTLSLASLLLLAGWLAWPLALASSGREHRQDSGVSPPRAFSIEAALVIGLCFFGFLRTTQALLGDLAYAQGLKASSLAEKTAMKQAVVWYLRALQIGVDATEVWYSLGLAWRELGKGQEALFAAQKAWELLPWPDRGMLLSDLEAKKGRIDEATEILQTILRIHPRYVWAYANLGILLKARHQTDRACRVFRRALSLRPTDPFLRATWDSWPEDARRCAPALLHHDAGTPARRRPPSR